MARRAPRLRSMSGPSSGDTMANGGRVKSRYRSTLSSAASGEIEKKSEPASEMVITVRRRAWRTAAATAGRWDVTGRRGPDEPGEPCP